MLCTYGIENRSLQLVEVRPYAEEEDNVYSLAG